MLYETVGGVADRIFCNGFESTACGNAAGTRYVYLGRHLIASDGVSGLSYIHTDALGSPVAYTIPIKPEHVDGWLNPDPNNLKALSAILDDRERPYYEHRLAA